MSATSLSQLTKEELILLGAMFLLLVLAAICDHICQEVPDALTIAYASLSCIMAVEHGEVWLAVVLMAIITYIQIPWRPKWHKKFNHWMVSRAYHGDVNTLEEIQNSSQEKAEALYDRWGQKFFIGGLAITYLAIFATILSFGFHGNTSVLAIAIVEAIYIVASVLAGSALISKGKVPEYEEISAIGGADVLVILGFFGTYGLFGGCLSIAISLLVALIWYLIHRIITRDKNRGFALLPGLCISAPIRLAVAIFFVAPIAYFPI